MKSFSFSNPTLRYPYLCLAGVGLIVLVIGKDLLHAVLKNYSFYLSESLLFGLFWFMFIPFLLVIKACRGKLKKRLKLLVPFLIGLIHIGTFSLIVHVLSQLFFSHSYPLARICIDTLAENGISCILVYGIFCGFLWQKEKASEQRSSEQKSSTDPPTSEYILVKHRGSTILIACEDIIYVKAEKPYISLITLDRTYLFACSLKQFLERYATKDFIQIHRSTLINTRYIASFSSRKNGDYDIALRHHHHVRASRTYQHQFKRYLQLPHSAS